MKSVLYDFKTAKEPWFEEACAVYIKKIRYFLDFEIVSLKSLKQSREDIEVKKKFEAEQILKKLNTDDIIFLFDENGTTPDSIAFSALIDKAKNSGKKRIVFIIGGAYGANDEVKSKAHFKVSLSKMVMNHLVAETVVLEQIYRSLTILNRIPYHNI